MFFCSYEQDTDKYPRRQGMGAGILGAFFQFMVIRRCMQRLYCPISARTTDRVMYCAEVHWRIIRFYINQEIVSTSHSQKFPPSFPLGRKETFLSQVVRQVRVSWLDVENFLRANRHIHCKTFEIDLSTYSHKSPLPSSCWWIPEGDMGRFSR